MPVSLHESVDGCELKLCSEAAESVAYLRSPHGIPGKDFKDYARLRINVLPSRGRNGPTACRGCGIPSETLAHIVQSCPRTHEGRLLRHDTVVKRIAGALSEKGYDVEMEHLYKLRGRSLKPDIVTSKDDDSRGKTSVILDVQIVSATAISATHSAKIRKYADQKDLHAKILDRHRSTVVRTVAATISWRGVWVPQSIQALRGLGLSSGLLAGLAPVYSRVPC